MIDLRNIETFFWAAALGSLRAASEKLGTTQPAISQRIASLEAALGVRLFERDARGVKLTAKGHELLAHAERMMQARRDMMVCALEGAMAFQKGLGAVHALTHPLGAIRELNLHHGTLNAVLMPAVLRFNREVIGGKWDVLASRMGGQPDDVVAALNIRLGMPSGLKEMGVTEAMMEQVSHAALKDHCHATNPRIASQADYLDILRHAA